MAKKPAIHAGGIIRRPLSLFVRGYDSGGWSLYQAIVSSIA
jgi:hypothetical protein